METPMFKRSMIRSAAARSAPLFVLLFLLLSACGPGAPGQPTPTATNTPPAGQAAPTPTAPAGSTQSPPPQSAGGGGTMFKNPVITHDFPDPFILKAGDTFYAYTTNSGGLNIQTATSKDLVHWELGKDALPQLPDWAQFTSGLTWAPEVMQISGKYVMYYTTRDKASDKQCVGAAVSDTPGGPFKDTRPGPLVCQADLGGSIDPDPFKDGDKLYLLFKNDGNCCGMPTSLFIQELAPDGLSLTSQPTKLISNDVAWEGNVVEAPTMFKHDGKYYLFFSGSDYSNEKYAVGYALCQSATGPCTQAAENPILKSHTEDPKVIGPGHQTLVQLGDQTWIVYHVWEISPETNRQTARRQMWIDKLDWVDGKPVVRGPTTGEQPAPVIK